jgi:uncharacterized protein YbjT (DUF2867 family)
MAKILIFGGHGKIAMLLSPILVAQGDTVTAIIRNPKHSDEVAQTGATAVVADLERLDVTGMAELVTGHDAVVWSAGAGGGSAERTTAVDRDAAIHTMDAALLVGISRYVMVSYFGSSTTHGLEPENSFFAYAEAKAAADVHLRESELEWTVLGPSSLTLEAPTGLIDIDATESNEVSRGNVARVIQATLNDPGTIRRTIRFNDGDTPVALAIADLGELTPGP